MLKYSSSRAEVYYVIEEQMCIRDRLEIDEIGYILVYQNKLLPSHIDYGIFYIQIRHPYYNIT